MKGLMHEHPLQDHRLRDLAPSEPAAAGKA